MEDLSGLTLGPFQIVERLGEGGMATVFKAFQPSMSRHVALKVLPRRYGDQPEFAARFEREAKILATLQHPNILPVFDYGRENGYAWIAMPWVSGGELTAELSGEPMPLKRLVQIIREVGDALDYAHERGVIHRDVKPSNILRDARSHCLLTDFGIAKLIRDDTLAGASHSMIGTPAYMAPEQSMGEPIDARVDIYSLGVVLYELATGRPPYRAETPLAVVMKHLHDPLPPPRSLNPAISEALQAVILKALAKKPADRFQKASELVDALNATQASDERVAGAETRAVKAPLYFAAVERSPLPTINFAELEPDIPVIAAEPLAARPTPAPRSNWAAVLLIGLAAAVIALTAWWFGRPTSPKFDPFAVSAAAPASLADAQTSGAAVSGTEPPPPPPPSEPMDPNLPPPSTEFDPAPLNSDSAPLTLPEQSAPGDTLPPIRAAEPSPPAPSTINAGLTESFDDVRFDGSYDRALWAAADRENQGTAKQRDGVLVLPGRPGEGNALLALDSTVLAARDVASFEILTRVASTDDRGAGAAGFSIGRTDDPKWWLSCTVETLEDLSDAQLRCDSSDGLDVQGEIANSADWRKLRAEFDLRAAKVRLIGDDTVLGSAHLSNAAELANAHLHLMLASWRTGKGEFNGEFDSAAMVGAQR